MEQLNEKLKKNNATLKISYGWLKNMDKLYYEDSIELNNVVYYLELNFRIMGNSSIYSMVSKFLNKFPEIFKFPIKF